MVKTTGNLPEPATSYQGTIATPNLWQVACTYRLGLQPRFSAIGSAVVTHEDQGQYCQFKRDPSSQPSPSSKPTEPNTHLIFL
ncbi:hypothetical protein SLEP1_g18004 [Rubroshorea leprosula]|uniref:Uncharacterized protein n=1 Tax=Rubroshorea leprosula TaxID=152421 RepID=A0AAV5J6Q1_9ROSI|nr:hypothetical protein SLEP1_g18004 [Rubroshorea leprosula]